MNDPTTDLLTSLKADFNQIKKQRQTFFSGPDDFIKHLSVNFQTDTYQPQLDFSDSEEEELPTKIKIMTIRTIPIIDIKPKKQKKQPQQDQIPVPLPQNPIKPVCLDKGTQSKIKNLTEETQTQLSSEGIEELLHPTKKDNLFIANTDSDFHVKAVRLRTEATNTDSVLPSYENVCIAFLESLLEDAPIFMNSAPKSEQIENILMAFLEQLLNDAKNFDVSQDLSLNQHEGSSTISKPIFKKTKLVDTTTQNEIPLQAEATQTPVCLKRLENPSTIFRYIPSRNLNLLQMNSPEVIYDKPGQHKKRNLEISKFTYPPSLKSYHEPTLGISPTLYQKTDTQTNQPEPKPQRKPNLRFSDALNIHCNDNTNVPQPKPQPINPILPQNPEKKQSQATDVKPIDDIPDDDSPHPLLPFGEFTNAEPFEIKQEQYPPRLNPLQIPPLNKEELASFDFSIYAKDFDSSDDDNNDAINTSDISGISGNYSSSIGMSTIDKELGSNVSNIHSMSTATDSGEIRDSSFGIDTNSIYSDSMDSGL